MGLDEVSVRHWVLPARHRTVIASGQYVSIDDGRVRRVGFPGGPRPVRSMWPRIVLLETRSGLLLSLATVDPLAPLDCGTDAIGFHMGNGHGTSAVCLGREATHRVRYGGLDPADAFLHTIFYSGDAATDMARRKLAYSSIRSLVSDVEETVADPLFKHIFDPIKIRPPG